ncbi:hypothetical protein DXG01_017237 [Tephrocybe rancida]|nr:hypothetical protein DXG01_017237 [Tephrocybe rancida]
MQLLTYADPKNKDQTGTANIKGMNTSSTITQDRLFNNFQGDFGLVATELMNDNRSISEYESIRDALLAKAFLLAANIVLELMGETTDVQTSFQQSSASGSGSFGYGLFHISASHSESNFLASTLCDATADGC